MRITEPKSPTKSGCQRKDCKYQAESGCTYFIVEDHSRLFLHEGENVDINNPCREYAPGEKVLLKMPPFTLSKDQLAEVMP